MSDFAGGTLGFDDDDGDWSPGEGNHQAVVVGAELRHKQATGELIAIFVLELEGSLTDDGRRWDHPLFFTSPGAKSRAREQLSIYGIDDAELRRMTAEHQLLQAMNRLVGTRVDVICSPRDGGGVWTQVYGATPPHPAEDAPADRVGQPPAPTEDDDIPF